MSPRIAVLRMSLGQALKICFVVGKWYLQSEHLGSVRYLQQSKLSGVGEVSEAALIIKDMQLARRQAL